MNFLNFNNHCVIAFSGGYTTECNNIMVVKIEKGNFLIRVNFLSKTNMNENLKKRKTVTYHKIPIVSLPPPTFK